ncbi:MAG: two-component regulator propeller domain-containing protein [Candidatus Micrarchaeaceae archaeon]
MVVSKRPQYLCFLFILIICACSNVTLDAPQGNWLIFTETDGLVCDNVQGVDIDGKGDIWFATLEGVSVLASDGTWTSYRADDGLGVNRTVDVLVDKNDRVWVATTGGGLCRFNGVSWEAFRTENSNLPDNYIIELAEDQLGNIWVLSSYGLSVVYPDDTIMYVGSPFSLAPGYKPTFHSLAIDAEGHIWIGTLGAALAEYDPENDRWSWIGRITEHVAIPLKNSSGVVIWDIAVDQENHLWIATNTIVEVEGEHWRIHQLDYTPLSVFVTPDGYKWFSTAGGTLLLLSPDNTRWGRYDPPWKKWYDPINSGWTGSVVNDMAWDSEGRLWFATENGAVQFILKQ